MQQQQTEKQWLKHLGLMLAGGAIAMGSIVSYSVVQTGDRLLTTLNAWFHPTPPAPKATVQSIVLQQVRDASELTTAIFTMQAVVPTSQDNTLGSFTVGTTRLLYIAYGEVRAGVDLGKLTPENVQVTDDRVVIQLPPPQLLTSKLDLNRSQVYDYDRGFLSLGPDSGPELQTLAQKEALKTIETAACNNKLLENANDRAKQVVTQLLATTGLQSVKVETQRPTACL